jgi:hypothetical protein
MARQPCTQDCDGLVRPVAEDAMCCTGHNSEFGTGDALGKLRTKAGA